jgi:FKBP-type peptidyl-prolyl cis-trans isomerase FklB
LRWEKLPGLLWVKEERRVCCKPYLEKDKNMASRKWMLAAAIGFLASFAASAQDSPDLKTNKDKVSYALGMKFGEGFRNQGLDVDPGVFAKAFAEAFSGGKTAMTDQEMQSLLTAAAQEIREKQAAQQAEKGAVAQKEGEEFLAANKTREGVVTLPSGLQYKILKAGTGEKPTPDDTVVCNYKGTLIDGTEFDASEKHGGSAAFPVKGVIAGWTQALQLMQEGSKWQLFVPSNLAYGAQGAGDIGPNATLIFEVELVSIQKAAAPAPGTSGSK